MTRRAAAVFLTLALSIAALAWWAASRRSPAAPRFDVAAASDGAQWSAELNRDATATVRYDGARVLSFKVNAWGPDWKFAGVKTSLGKGADTAYALKGDIGDLAVTLGGTVTWAGDKLVYEWTTATDKPTRGNVGGAISLALRPGVTDIFDAKTVAKPTIDADKQGLTWNPIPGTGMSVRFENLAGGGVAFERGNTNDVRAWFLPGDLDAGTRTVRMTIQLPPGATFRGVPANRLTDPDAKTWHLKTLDWNVSPVDLSYLNDKPAGGHGFVKAQGDGFVFADGTPVKFWGCNVQAYALFGKNAAIEQQAKRIAALGYNLVRLHHHDSADWVNPTVFAAGNDTQHLDAAALDRIDYWVKCLKDQGVYVWLDLHVGRPFRPGDDIPAFNELKTNPGDKSPNHQARGFNYVNDRVTTLMKDFARAYLTRTNRYTGLAYTDEPAVMGVLVTNENDITDHFGNLFLPDKNTPTHRKLFEAFRDKVVKAVGIDAGKAGQTWVPGPGKVVLNQLQYDWSKDFVDYLRGLGVKVPIATTNTWGSDPLFSLPALTAGDVIDVHAYGLSDSLSGNPRYDESSALWIAAAQVAGKPLTITEWNTPYPQRDRFTQPLYIAAMAAFQGWDAPMVFGYQQEGLGPPWGLHEWSTSNDPALTPLMPAAALMYRRGDVAPAEQTVVLQLPAEKLLYGNVSPATSALLRTAPEQHRLQIAMPQTPLLPWLVPSEIPAGAQVLTDPSQILLPRSARSVTSDTGQLTRTWPDGLFTIDTPRTQAAAGWMLGKTIALGDVTLTITTPKAALVVTSLDGQPIATSKKMLLTVAAQAGTKGGPNNIVAEPVVGTVTFKNPVDQAYTLSPQGKTAPLATAGSTLTLDGTAATHWFVLTR